MFEYMEIISGFNKENEMYLHKYLLNMIENPSSPQQAVALLHPEKGFGKSMLAEVLWTSMLGSKRVYNAGTNIERNIFSTFNGHLEGIVLVISEELTHEDYAKMEMKFRSQITAPRLDLQGKNKEAKNVPNLLHHFHSSNNLDATQIKQLQASLSGAGRKY